MTDSNTPTQQNKPAALLSVFDKTHIVSLAKGLISHGYQIISSGGTYKALTAEGVAVTEVSDVTDFPEMMGGRVKTLHPKVHGGILFRRGQDEDLLATHNIPCIDLVVVNLYPFAHTISQPDCTLAQAIEQIDIGGPTLIRAAAKNHAAVTILTDPADYKEFTHLLKAPEQTETLSGFRQQMALKAFQHTAHYDSVISQYLFAQYQPESNFPETFLPALTQQSALRYGENPHQAAALYREAFPAQPNLVDATQAQGKPPSYNNIADADAALDTIRYFDSPACVIVKHANPCGVACAENVSEAYQKAWATDPTSAFGGIIAFNREVDGALANTILDKQFVEVILAPAFSANALEALSKKPNLRVLTLKKWAPETQASAAPKGWHCKRVAGGLLVQTQDDSTDDTTTWKVVTKAQPSEAVMKDLAFAWKVVRAVKSNAIVFARGHQTLGIGAGQMSRVFSTRIACDKANEAKLALKNCVMASDAFFPFADGLEAAIEAGVSAVVQPGGSVRDEEVIAAADAAGIAMVFTGKRHFNH
jgi:phosphoribosylaminoimidazolecarboxamide formyltransferase/IMP cyclohydrolase